MPRLENEAGDAGVLHDVTPAGISDVVRRAQHGGRRIPVPVPVAVRPISHALPLPGATVGAGHATRSPGLHLGQAGLALPAAYRGAVRALCRDEKRDCAAAFVNARDRGARSIRIRTRTRARAAAR